LKSLKKPAVVIASRLHGFLRFAAVCKTPYIAIAVQSARLMACAIAEGVVMSFFVGVVVGAAGAFAASHWSLFKGWTKSAEEVFKEIGDEAEKAKSKNSWL
jgi:hypothetical protein